MGCGKSKQTCCPFPNLYESEKQHESEEPIMPEEKCLPRMPSPVNVKEEVKEPPGTNTVILDYAYRLSQEILRDALQEWSGNNIKYHDIPYIESEEP
nr:small membrane A-kinase anchor protein [Aotus nancymaae]XP_012319549.1 small membrane A-kinase anchor protein [Aotus nancymaae]